MNKLLLTRVDAYITFAGSKNVLFMSKFCLSVHMCFPSSNFVLGILVPFQLEQRTRDRTLHLRLEKPKPPYRLNFSSLVVHSVSRQGSKLTYHFPRASGLVWIGTLSGWTRTCSILPCPTGRRTVGGEVD